MIGLLAAVAAGPSAAVAERDTGRYRPPTALSESNKAIWMSEWVACRHKSLAALAREIGVKIPSGRTPQTAARLIARKAEGPLWIHEPDLVVAIDGCRNGILWRYYHEKGSVTGR